MGDGLDERPKPIPHPAANPSLVPIAPAPVKPAQGPPAPVSPVPEDKSKSDVGSDPPSDPKPEPQAAPKPSFTPRGVPLSGSRGGCGPRPRLALSRLRLVSRAGEDDDLWTQQCVIFNRQAAQVDPFVFRREVRVDHAASPRRHRPTVHAGGGSGGKGEVAAEVQRGERERGGARVGERYCLDRAGGAHLLSSEVQTVSTQRGLRVNRLRVQWYRLGAPQGVISNIQRGRLLGVALPVGDEGQDDLATLPRL